MKQYKPQEIERFLLRRGWIVDHQTGSHRIMYHPVNHQRVPIPMHNKDIAIGTLMAILKQTGYKKKDLEE